MLKMNGNLLKYRREGGGCHVISHSDIWIILTIVRNKLRDDHGQWHCNFITFLRSL